MALTQRPLSARGRSASGLEGGVGAPRQFVAAVVDAIVFIPVALVTSVVTVLMFAYAMGPFYSSSSQTIPNWVAITTCVVFVGTWYALGALYFARLCAFGGRTLGMVVAGVALSSASSHSNAGWGRAMARWSVIFVLGSLGLVPILVALVVHVHSSTALLVVVVLAELPFVVDLLSPAWSPGRRAWHDRVAGLRIVARSQFW